MRFVCLVLIVCTQVLDGIGSVALSTSKRVRIEYPPATIPFERELIKEEAAQVLLSSLLVSSVSVPEFVSNQNVPTSFALFAASAASSDKVASRIAIAPTLALAEIETEELPIVCLHGFDSSAIEYRRLAPLIAQKRDVYVPDVLGWGFSDCTNVLSYTPEAKMAHLKSFITNVVGKKCIIVGASLGGALAIILAAEAPELVEKVILIDAQGFIDGKGPGQGPPDFLARLGVRVLKSTPLRMFANYIAYKDKAFATWDAMLIGRLHCLLDTWEDTSVAFLLSGGFIMSEKVAEVNKETLVIWGRNDEILEPSTAFKFQEILPQCKDLRWIEECGHVPHLEKPQETAQAILNFLGDI
jgi:pimeloyl-ACP methyl ester carboxylesterase